MIPQTEYCSRCMYHRSDSFHLTDLRPGLILNMSTHSTIGWLIRQALRFGFKGPVSEIPNHDAIIIKHGDKLWIGESLWPVARLTPIEDYEKEISSGYIYRIRVLAVYGATPEDEEAAAQWWMENVNNSPYDWKAFPRLLWKALFGNWINSACGSEWARWCTEGVWESWKNGGRKDPWGKINPTPLTTYKRWKQGAFISIYQVDR